MTRSLGLAVSGEQRNSAGLPVATCALKVFTRDLQMGVNRGEFVGNSKVPMMLRTKAGYKEVW